MYIRSASARRPFVSNAPPSSHSCAATIGVATFTYLWQAGARSHGVCRAEREGFAAIRQARPLSACGPYSLNWPLSLSCWARFSALRIAATEKESSEGAASVLFVCHPRSLLRTAVVLRVTKRVRCGSRCSCADNTQRGECHRLGQAARRTVSTVVKPRTNTAANASGSRHAGVMPRGP